MRARRGRSRRGDLRIDKAIDHFGVMGYAARDVRAVVTDLLKVIFDSVSSSLVLPPASSVGLWRYCRVWVFLRGSIGGSKSVFFFEP